MTFGYVDVWNDNVISGWAEIPGGGAPADIRVEIDGRYVGSVQADLYRPDLQRNVGYSIDISNFPRGLARKMALRVGDSDLVLRPTEADPTSERATHSLYGGMWIDRNGWRDVLDGKMSSGEVDDELAQQLVDFERDGYIIIPGAVDRELLDRLNQDIEDVWAGNVEGLKIESYSVDIGQLRVVPVDAQYRYGSTKLLDPHLRLSSARYATSAPRVVKFLEAIFEEPARAFQQLCFTMGSQQPIHKDTAYVKVDGNPMSMAATWLALEDISDGTGELEYYVGSHRSADYVFGGISKWLEHSPAQHMDFLDSLHRDAERLGQKRSKFLGRAGDVLVWHADLAHGGSKITNPGVTRKSLVTHYTAKSHSPFYMRFLNHKQVEVNGVSFTSQYGEMDG